MPTVRPDIKPVAVFPSPTGKSNTETLRVFPAEEWEKWGGEVGLYRVMIGERWVARKGERCSFYDQEGLGEVLRRWGLAALGLRAAPQPGSVLPDCPAYSYVWLRRLGETDLPARTKGVPFRDSEGDWRVWLLNHKEPVPLDNLSKRQRGEGVTNSTNERTCL